jgi:hypothetical protein
MNEYVAAAERLNRSLFGTDWTSADIVVALAHQCPDWPEDEKFSVHVLAARLAEGTFSSDEEEQQKWFRLSTRLSAHLDLMAGSPATMPNPASAETSSSRLAESRLERLHRLAEASEPISSDRLRGSVLSGEPHILKPNTKVIGELDFFAFGLYGLAWELDVGANKLRWYIEANGLQRNEDFFKEIKIGRSTHKRYSRTCLEYLRDRFSMINLDAVFAVRHRY